MSIGTLTPARSIGQIVADITISEEHADELTITRHPVEQGATISDHAIKEPATVSVRCAWSDATPGNGDGFVIQMYAQLLALQVARELLTVQTGKRQYQNMLIKAVRLTTDEKTETALFVTLDLQEIIIVSVTTTSIPPAANQKDPQLTSPVANTGTKQPIPAPAVSPP